MGGNPRLGIHKHWVAARVMWTKALPTLLTLSPSLISPYKLPNTHTHTTPQKTHIYWQSAVYMNVVNVNWGLGFAYVALWRQPALPASMFMYCTVVHIRYTVRFLLPPIFFKCHLIVCMNPPFSHSQVYIFPSLGIRFEIVMLTPTQMDLCVLMKLDLERRRGYVCPSILSVAVMYM